jgi:hypothetical protein
LILPLKDRRDTIDILAQQERADRIHRIPRIDNLDKRPAAPAAVIIDRSPRMDATAVLVGTACVKVAARRSPSV